MPFVVKFVFLGVFKKRKKRKKDDRDEKAHVTKCDPEK
jgi:hypothetical protein